MESSKEQEVKTDQTVAEAGKAVPAEEKKEKKDSKAEREKKKQERLAARQEKTQAQKEEWKKDPNDPCADKFGDLELNRSQSDPEKRYARKFTEVHELDESMDG